MRAGLRAVWSVVRAALYGWIIALVALVRRLVDLIRRRKADDRDEHERNAAKTRCVPIEDPAFVRPDPLIYSQKFLMEQGLNVTWQNPDFVLSRGGVAVDSHALEPDTTYDVVARVWNDSVDGPVIDMPVHLSFLSFGAGTQLHQVGTRKVDVGVKGGANEPAFVTFEWTTPREVGHYCLQVLLDPVDDAQFGNNLGQHNTNVVDTQSPVSFRSRWATTPSGPTTITSTSIPTSFPSLGRARTNATTDRGREQDNPIDRVHRDAHPLPAGWSVDITPDHPSIAPGAHQQILVTVNPPDGFDGVQVINVHALYREYYEDRVAGGVTVTIRADAEMADDYKQYTTCSQPSIVALAGGVRRHRDRPATGWRGHRHRRRGLVRAVLPPRRRGRRVGRRVRVVAERAAHLSGAGAIDQRLACSSTSSRPKASPASSTNSTPTTASICCCIRICPASRKRRRRRQRRSVS